MAEKTYHTYIPITPFCEEEGGGKGLVTCHIKTGSNQHREC